ncbi:hypothetical protein O181_033277 [Austropuccinia psidii MF-1]|uniref:Uncharacterized protein n=1 Tax=Austropuccinia psidii MF-1 TaxID=1389203 RepID=A0A9Q3D4A5_9BASI|nr:hypothetical protein [Austropuccinia psidii MF-1]
MSSLESIQHLSFRASCTVCIPKRAPGRAPWRRHMNKARRPEKSVDLFLSVAHGTYRTVLSRPSSLESRYPKTSSISKSWEHPTDSHAQNTSEFCESLAAFDPRAMAHLRSAYCHSSLHSADLTHVSYLSLIYDYTLLRLCMCKTKVLV